MARGPTINLQVADNERFYVAFTRWWEEAASDYGRSMGRPLIWLGCAWLILRPFAPLVYLASAPDTPPELVTVCRTATSRSLSEYLSTIARQFLPAALNSAIATSPTWLRCATANSPFVMFVLNALQVISFVSFAALFCCRVASSVSHQERVSGRVRIAPGYYSFLRPGSCGAAEVNSTVR